MDLVLDTFFEDCNNMAMEKSLRVTINLTIKMMSFSYHVR